jgi:DNA polymerase II large subunit
MMKVSDYMNTEVKGRCMKCKDNRTITVTTFTRAKNGVAVLKGTCPDCGTTVVRMVGKIED